MAKSSVFIFEIEKINNLEKEIFNSFGKLKINFKKPFPWEGFLKNKIGNDIQFIKDSFGSFRFMYAVEDEKDDVSLNGENIKKRIKFYVPVWVDLDTKLILVFSSNAGTAYRIVRKIIETDGNKINLSPLKLEINFLKWLEEVKDFGKSILMEIHGTRAINLSEIDGVADTLSLTTNSRMRDCQVYSLIKGKGSRVYLRGLFKVGESMIDATFYSIGKITLSKKKSMDMTLDEIKHASKEIFFEIKKLNQKWKESN